MKYFILALVLSACATQKKATQVTAKLISKNKSSVIGEIHFVQYSSHVVYSANVSGLKPNSKHGFHIHEFGDCSSADGKSAGGHFNPGKHSHGNPDSQIKHVGDLGNLHSDSKGHAQFSGKQLSKNLLNSESDSFIIGKAIIIHDKMDDFKSQPTGNAGKRIACGVIR